MTDYKKPNISLLEPGNPIDKTPTEEMNKIGDKIKDLLASYDVPADLLRIEPEPFVTSYCFSQKANHRNMFDNSDKIAAALGVENIRFRKLNGVAPWYAIEVPNKTATPMRMRDALEQDSLVRPESNILITGATGSGKSMALHSVIMSLVYKTTPDNHKLLIIDTKGVDFAPWHDIPHLIAPIVTDATAGVNALKWLAREIDRRGRADNNMPHITVIVDELADLAAISRRDVETAIHRIATQGDKAGISLILATGRADENTITDIIRTHIPKRMTFHATGATQSKAMFDEGGAEQLTRYGDALFRHDPIKKEPWGDTFIRNASNLPFRINTPYISENEINAVANHLRAQGAPKYIDHITAAEDTSTDPADLYEQARDLVIGNDAPDIKYIKRRLNISYTKAADLLYRMQDAGIVSAPNEHMKRTVLVK